MQEASYTYSTTEYRVVFKIWHVHLSRKSTDNQTSNSVLCIICYLISERLWKVTVKPPCSLPSRALAMQGTIPCVWVQRYPRSKSISFSRNRFSLSRSRTGGLVLANPWRLMPPLQAFRSRVSRGGLMGNQSTAVPTDIGPRLATTAFRWQLLPLPRTTSELRASVELRTLRVNRSRKRHCYQVGGTIDRMLLLQLLMHARASVCASSANISLTSTTGRAFGI